MTPRELGWTTPTVDGMELLQQVGSFDVGTPVQHGLDERFRKTVSFWVPRRWVTAETMDVEGVVAELEEIVSARGLLTPDGQVLTSLRRTGPWEASFEASTIDARFDPPARRTWGVEQRDFFAIEDPYQMVDDEGPFTWSSIHTTIADSYLTLDERIAAVVHGRRDRCNFTCPCHYAQVAYTTRHRLVCMSCGATHLVLREPVLSTFGRTVTAEEWDELFGIAGSRHHEPLDLAIVDVQDLEAATPYVWLTSQWEEALLDFNLRTRATPEEYDAAIRRTEPDPSVLLEAGFHPVLEPPEPASQLLHGALDIDMLENAAHAYALGVSAYLQSYVRPRLLIDVVKNLFQTVELLLKVRLEESNPLGLQDRPNNPAVIERLSAIGVTLAPSETNTLRHLRMLRNEFQHDSARFNQRETLALSRDAISLIDRFALEELEVWSGDAIAPHEWRQLLRIPDIHQRAISVADRRLEHYRCRPEAEITQCPECDHDTMIRPHQGTGASCALCRYVPIATA